MANPFPSTEPAWGLRAYLILIGCAADHQTVTYDALARRVKRGGPNLLAKPLGLITRWCQNHSLPALASLVVEQATGLPAPGFGGQTLIMTTWPIHLLNNPIISAFASVLKCKLKPTTAADVSAFTSSLSVFTANTV